ncbi:hypothetical protein [Chondromyces apiculatus]|uniref:Uncharacterized protein n=1 Tax=Chondromyces apiculatus DSM 436 TaxID=1192034 RepID=A0A017TE47_9BACT|nr:hypothetical protein [Chondromyces apiculatus]EYF07197.1 Hypothetical protein CAP_0676 [Chondromyces apiculatus DSM 436]
MTSGVAPPDPPSGPIPLEGIAYGTQGLEAFLAIHLGDAHIHAAFVREGTLLPLTELAPALCAAYRASQGAALALPARLRRSSSAPSLTDVARGTSGARAPLGSAGTHTTSPGDPRLAHTTPTETFSQRSLATASGSPGTPGGTPLPFRTSPAVLSSRPPREPSEPLITLEESGCIVLLRRVRAYLVVCLFDAALPLGMARLLASRLTSTLSPELPRGEVSDVGEPTSTADSAPRSVVGEGDRARRLLELVSALAPEPHVARLRVSLRAGIPPAALEHPTSIGPEAVPRLETAVEEILGLDRAALRRLL